MPADRGSARAETSISQKIPDSAGSASKEEELLVDQEQPPTESGDPEQPEATISGESRDTGDDDHHQDPEESKEEEENEEADQDDDRTMPVRVECAPPPPANSKQLGVHNTLLYNGSRFKGSQKSKGNSYAVEVVLQVSASLEWTGC